MIEHFFVVSCTLQTQNILYMYKKSRNIEYTEIAFLLRSKNDSRRYFGNKKLKI